MEKDPSLGAADYTTHYRLLNTRIGRWLSVDPEAQLYYSWSPYNLSADNPIANSDPSGATFTGATKKVEEVEDYARTVLTAQNTEIERLNVLIKEKGINSRLEKQLGTATRTRDAAQATLDELSILRNSPIIYNIIIRDAGPGDENKGGQVYAGNDPTYKTVNVLSLRRDKQPDKVTMGQLVHELKHAYQFEIGRLSLRVQPNKKGQYIGGGLFDIGDEVEAYQRQRDLGFDTYFPNNREITGELIKEYSDDYDDAPMSEANMNTIVSPNISTATYGSQLLGTNRAQGRAGRPVTEMVRDTHIHYQQGVDDRQ